MNELKKIMESFQSARRHASFKQTCWLLHVQFVLVKLRTQRSEYHFQLFFISRITVHFFL